MRAGRARAGWLALSIAVALGCDVPVSRETTGPSIVRIVPDPFAAPIDRLATFRIEVDRRIAPASLPQGVVEITSGENYVYVDTWIDVVTPAIVVRPFDALDPSVAYTMVVHPFDDLEGNASLESSAAVFHTTETATIGEPDPVSWVDVAPIFATCATARCHDGDAPVLGLDLSSAAAVRATALGVAAREVAPSVSGYLAANVTASLVGLPRIEPRDPARSYLLYTMVGDEHIAGAPMPPDAPVSDASLRLVQRWIRAGAPGI